MSTGKKTTMVVRLSGQTVVDPELVSVMGNEYHITLTENESGQLVLRAVSGLLLISPTAWGKALVFTQPFKKESQE